MSPRSLPNTFFTDRFCNDAVRCFAAEVLVAIPILYEFAIQILAPLSILQEHIECLWLLRLILQILTLGDKAVEMADILEEAIEQHRALFVRLYAEAKPKLHDLLHIPTIVGTVCANIKCFVTERKHKQIKTACAHIYGNFEHALTKLRSELASP